MQDDRTHARQHAATTPLPVAWIILMVCRSHSMRNQGPPDRTSLVASLCLTAKRGNSTTQAQASQSTTCASHLNTTIPLKTLEKRLATQFSDRASRKLAREHPV